MKFFRLERLYQPPKKWKLAFQKYKPSNSFFKIQLQICVFPNFNLQILSSKSNLRSSFTNLFNFKFSKTCWKVRNYIKEAWLIFKKWVWRVDFERFFFEKKSILLRKMRSNKRFSLIGKMKADKTAKSFPTYRILVLSKLHSLDQTYQTSKKRIR